MDEPHAGAPCGGHATGRPCSAPRRSSGSPGASPSPKRTSASWARRSAIAARHPRGNVAIATHGDLVRILVAHYGGAHLDHFQRTLIDTASVSVDPPRRRDPTRPARERHGGPGSFRAAPSRRLRHREGEDEDGTGLAAEPARIGRMDFGPVDRITADAIGEPGDRTFYLQARAGDERDLDRRREATGPAARGLDPRAAGHPRARDRDRSRRRGARDSRSRSSRGGGPGKLSIGYDEDRDMFLLEIEEFQPEVEDDDPRSLLAERAGGRAALGHARADVRPARATGRRSPTAGGRRASSAATRSIRRATRVPR